MKPERADPSALAAVTARLAVLLDAGVPPPAGWAYIDETTGHDENASVHRVALSIRAGMTVPEAICSAALARPAIEQVAWRGLAAAWAVATDAGAPLASTLRQFSTTLQEFAQAQREVDVALAAPTLTARLVLALPLVGIVFGMLLGFDTLGVLFATPAGLGCIGVGGALLFGASRWNRHLVRRAQPSDLAPGVVFDLVAIAASGGASLDRAVLSVASCTERYGVDSALDDVALVEVLELSRRAGVPAAALLRGEAVERRRAAFAAAQIQARALGVRLMIPLGVCVLPAFMVVSVVPVLLAVLQQTTLSG